MIAFGGASHELQKINIDLAERADDALNAAYKRLSNITDDQLLFLNANLKTGQLDKKKIDNFFKESYQSGIHPVSSVASVSSEENACRDFQKHSYTVGYSFGFLEKEEQEKVMTHEIGHALLGHGLQYKNIQAFADVSKFFLPICMGLSVSTPAIWPLTGMIYGVSFLNTRISWQQEHDADLIADVLVPEVPYERVIANENLSNFVIEHTAEEYAQKGLIGKINMCFFKDNKTDLLYHYKKQQKSDDFFDNIGHIIEPTRDALKLKPHPPVSVRITRSNDNIQQIKALGL